MDLDSFLATKCDAKLGQVRLLYDATILGDQQHRTDTQFTLVPLYYLPYLTEYDGEKRINARLYYVFLAGTRESIPHGSLCSMDLRSSHTGSGSYQLFKQALLLAPTTDYTRLHGMPYFVPISNGKGSWFQVRWVFVSQVDRIQRLVSCLEGYRDVSEGFRPFCLSLDPGAARLDAMVSRTALLPVTGQLALPSSVEDTSHLPF